jgi:serine/threonine protein kinase
VTAAVLRAGDRVRGERGREYQVLEWRGEGSFSRIYRAQEARPGGAFSALKLAKADVTGAAERIERERTVRARVRHARLAELRDTGRWDGAPFLVLAWIDGTDLRRMVERQRRLPLVTALGYLQDAAAVAALHAGGFAHGDLRPQNLLVEEATAHATLVDLGEASDRSDADPPARRREDLAALGDMLAFMLTGQGPEASPHRLTTANGYNPDAVRLCEESRAGHLTAAALQKEVASLLKKIGAVRRP